MIQVKILTLSFISSETLGTITIICLRLRFIWKKKKETTVAAFSTSTPTLSQLLG